MQNEKLKYQKRAWCKITARVFMSQRINNTMVELIVYKAKKKIKFTCFNALQHDILKLNPHDKINIWFSGVL